MSGAGKDGLRSALLGVMRSQVMALNGGYETAEPSRLRPDRIHARGGSADSHLGGYTLDRLRRQCEDLDRNSGVARSLVQRQQDVVVADGFSLLCKTESEEWNKAAEWLFNRCAGEDEEGAAPPKLVRKVDLAHPELSPLDIRGDMCLAEIACEVLRAWNYAGDIGVLRTVSENKGGQVQLIEGARIRNPGRGFDVGLAGEPGGGGNGAIVGGVEMDSAGRPLRYHVAVWDQRGADAGMAARAVSAEHMSLLKNPLRKITGLSRGEPTLQAAVRRLEHLEAMDETVIVSMRLQASITAYIQLENPGEAALLAPGEERTREDGTTEKIEEWEPGSVKRLGLNERVVFPTPAQPATTHESYILMQILLIGAEMGLPLPISLLDARQVNLSTIRCVNQVALKRLERLQKSLKRELYIPLYLFKVARFIEAGLLPRRPDWMAHEWITPPPPVMDPVVELNEARGLVDARFKSKQRVLREKYGVNSDTEDARIALEQKRNEEMGIEPVGTPGASGPAVRRGDDKETE